MSSQFTYDFLSTFIRFLVLLSNPKLLGWRRGSYSNRNPDHFGVKSIDTYLLVDDSSNLVDLCCWHIKHESYYKAMGFFVPEVKSAKQMLGT